MELCGFAGLAVKPKAGSYCEVFAIDQLSLDISRNSMKNSINNTKKGYFTL
jgi:hypothetical protein